MLVERTGRDVADAFTLLRAHAHTKRLHLSDVVCGVVEGSMTIDSLSPNVRPDPSRE